MASHDHGSTPAAWTSVSIAFVGFLLGCIAILQLDEVNWPLFVVGAALLVVALVVGKVMQMMGMGAAQDADEEATAAP